ncbi:hypothetical protein CL176_00195 [Suicoccus acidiformans]|uniref:Uncharacterized protein n=1 Tax=Suicoccus acidiformans TaxID=2036206 RepID=A0A347WHL4_9LACT|nr:hypothetical protein [Suicoccus acidiformans]AXY24571.1 hypothetical protein CL176_00195 [Suicoccus acidiformans]
MKRRTKRNIGLAVLGSTIAVAGVALYIYFDETAREKVQGAVNRERAKMYVRHRLNGSEALVKAVDNLSNEEINTLARLADSAVEAKDTVSDTLDSLVDKAKNATETVTDRVGDFFN